MRKIGITLWLVAILLAAGLSAILLRTNLLAVPQARSTDPPFHSNPGASIPPANAPAPASTRPPSASPSVPTTSPADTPPAAASGPDDFYQALQRIAQQLMGNGDDPGSGFLAWYRQLEAAYGQTVPADVAFAWFQHHFSDGGHAAPKSSTEALACTPGTFSPRTCGGHQEGQG
jgi:hypothetical protein